MFMNHVDRPSKQALVEIMRKVNALGHAPRVVVELDKFSYVPGLKKKYDVVEFITKQTTKNIVSITGGTADGSGYASNKPVMPIQGKTTLSDMVITDRHRSVNPERPKHKGLDLDLAKGDPVVSSWDGEVTEVKFDDGGYGHYITVDHGNSVKTRYAHLDKTSVNVGEKVKAGQVIGLGGNSGGVVSTTGDGSHLHFEVWKDGVDINPEPVLKGEVSMNGVTGNATKTVTKGSDKVSYERDLNSMQPDGKFTYPNAEYFSATTPSGSRKGLGFSAGVRYPNEYRSFEFKHTWFSDGYLEFAFFFNKGAGGDLLEVQMDGNTVWSWNAGETVSSMSYPTPITVPKGDHTFKFMMTNDKLSSAKFGVTKIKCAEYDHIEEQTNVTWDYEDGMNDASRWTAYNNSTIQSGGDHLYVVDNANATDGSKGFERLGVVSFPFTMQVRLKVSADTTGSNIYISDGATMFKPSFLPAATVYDSSSTTQSYEVDNTQWQEYLLVAKDSDSMVIFHKRDGNWEDTGLNVQSESYSTNRLLFYVPGFDIGTLYVDDVKYSDKDYSTTSPTTTREIKTTPTWYELGGFVFDETFYLEADIMNWEVSTHMDMSSATARVTLSNHHGLYSPEYVRSTVFPENMQKNPYTYYEEGEVRHVVSEYTPVRIYAGYGDQVVRVFTGMIKGEVEEDSEERTITFNCVDRYDLLEECVLLKEMSFPPQESFGGDAKPRPWIKSSIVQALANHAGMTGWRYVFEDMLHPDLVIEETYYTDISQSNNTFMKFNSKGVLEQTSLTVRTPSGYKNPFVESIVFSAGERVSDCIRRIVDEINFRAYVNRYGTFVMHRLDYENNMRWNFRSGENLYSLNTATDYSRVRSHIIVVGSNGNKEHFFDKDLLVATKGHIRTAQVDAPWIDESNGASAHGAKKVVADKLFFDMKRQARTKSVVVKGNPFIEVLDGCYVYDTNTSTSGYYLIKGNTLIGDANGMINRLELTWEEKVN